MRKKLFIVRVVREAFVLADNEDAAKDKRREIDRWEDVPTVTATPWTGENLTGWNDACGVYGAENVSLKTAKKVHFGEVLP